MREPPHEGFAGFRLYRWNRETWAGSVLTSFLSTYLSSLLLSLLKLHLSSVPLSSTCLAASVLIGFRAVYWADQHQLPGFPIIPILTLDMCSIVGAVT